MHYAVSITFGLAFLSVHTVHSSCHDNKLQMLSPFLEVNCVYKWSEYNVVDEPHGKVVFSMDIWSCLRYHVEVQRLILNIRSK